MQNQKLVVIILMLENRNIVIDSINIAMVDGASIDNGFDFGVLNSNNVFPFVPGHSIYTQIDLKILAWRVVVLFVMPRLPQPCPEISL